MMKFADTSVLLGCKNLHAVKVTPKRWLVKRLPKSATVIDPIELENLVSHFD